MVAKFFAPLPISKLIALFIFALVSLISVAGFAQPPAMRQPSLNRLATPVSHAHAKHAASKVTSRESGQAIDNPVFLPPVDYYTGGNPQQVAIADVNGDGIPDLLVANFGGETQKGVDRNGGG